MKVTLSLMIASVSLSLLLGDTAASDSPQSTPNVVQEKPHSTYYCPNLSQNLRIDQTLQIPGNGYEILVFKGTWRNCLLDGDNQMVPMLLADATPSGYTFCANNVSFILPHTPNYTWYENEAAWNGDNAGRGKMGMIIDEPFTAMHSAFTARNRLGHEQEIDGYFATGYFKAPSSLAGTAYSQCLQETKGAKGA